ncbi:TPA: hypothetical protein ACNGZF_000554 [Escherichia coli]|nr:hypothetical protein [Escherichia coli]
MAISQEQQKRGLEHLKQIRRKYFNESSEAAEWWDNLTPEWRGVVLHAAAVTSGTELLSCHSTPHFSLINRLNFLAMFQVAGDSFALRKPKCI